MRILIVNWNDRENPQAGGAEVHLHEIFGRIAAEGHEVTLLCSGWDGAAPRASVGGLEVHRIGKRYTFQFLARGYFSRTLAEQRHDVLVEDINKVPLYTPWWRLGSMRVVALVPHLMGSTVFEEANVVMGTMVWTSEQLLALVYRAVPFQAISDSTADDLVSRGIQRSRIQVIYPGIDPERFTPAPALRARYPLFAYLGRLKRYKGVDIVIRAFAMMRHPTAMLEIAGTGDFRPELEKLVHSLDLGSRVRFLGFIDETEKLELLRKSWALAFASPKEGWGITNIEAAACATPVIASDSPGLRETVRHGETGFLVPHGDVAAFAAALGRIASSRSLVDSLGAVARPFAEHFTWEAAARLTLEHLVRTVSGGR